MQNFCGRRVRRNKEGNVPLEKKMFKLNYENLKPRPIRSRCF